MVSPVNFVSNVKQTLTNSAPLEIFEKLMMIFDDFRVNRLKFV